MADERDDDLKDVEPGPEREREAGAGGQSDEASDAAGDVDARRLEITPERPNRRPPTGS